MILGIYSIIKNYITFEDKAFNFHEFFRTYTGDFSKDYANVPQGAEIGDFIHEEDVVSFLNLIFCSLGIKVM